MYNTEHDNYNLRVETHQDPKLKVPGSLNSSLKINSGGEGGLGGLTLCGVTLCGRTWNCVLCIADTKAKLSSKESLMYAQSSPALKARKYLRLFI